MSAERKTRNSATAPCVVVVASLLFFTQFSIARGEKNFEGPPSPPVPVAHFSQTMRIVLSPDGRLMGIYLQTADGSQSVAARYSKDDGHSWSAAATLLKLPRGIGTWAGPEAMVDHSGEIHLFLLNDANTGVLHSGEANRPKSAQMRKRHLDIWHTKSVDGRAEWLPLKRIWEGYTGSLNSVIQLRNGRIVLPFSYLTTRIWSDRGEGFDDFTFKGHFDSTVLYSDDQGSSWRLSRSHLEVPVPDIVSAYGAVEPVVLQLKDGRVWMLIRTQMGRFYESFSINGIAWSAPQPTSIISSDSPAGLLRLKDGRILLLWNDCQRYPYAYGGRQVLQGAISADEGRTWKGYREVVRDPLRNQPPPVSGDFGTGYPYPTLTRDGKVLLHTGQGKGRSFLVLLDPRWLDATRQATHFSKGLNGWSVFGTKGVALVPDPGKPGVKVLGLCKPEVDWPSGAVWNFPDGEKGFLRLRILLEPGFKDLLVGLTDQFSPPFDAEDLFYNLFNLRIGPGGQFANGSKIGLNRWHNLELRWDLTRRDCQVILDGQNVEILPLMRESSGVCYLRLRSTAQGKDSQGMLVESVSADVSASWTK